ncbi:methyltransferase [Streptodolium elevatio]|uniref:Methyltransferase n=1 Tax=Streptodolium elevatio TaxID=3157996 RepID=A0ABV3DM34_9ACTN
MPTGPSDAAPAMSPDYLVQLGLGFTASKTFLSAVELGVFDELAREGGLDAHALAETLGIHRRSARDFFDALVALGLLERDGGRYANTALTDHFLDRGKPTYIGDGLAMANTRLYGFWGGLTTALRTGRPQNEGRDSGDTYSAIYQDPERARLFQRAMTQLSMPSIDALAGRTTFWKQYRTVADIGAGDGGLLRRLLLDQPHLTGVGFDLPASAQVFAEDVAEAGLAEHVSFRAGDLRTDQLPHADVLVLGHMLHDWDAAAKRDLVAKAYAALPDGGALVAFESFLDDDRRTNATALLLSLNVLIETPGGAACTAAECRALLEEVGFRETRSEHLAGPESMVVGIK